MRNWRAFPGCNSPKPLGAYTVDLGLRISASKHLWEVGLLFPSATTQRGIRCSQLQPLLLPEGGRDFEPEKLAAFCFVFLCFSNPSPTAPSGHPEEELGSWFLGAPEAGERSGLLGRPAVPGGELQQRTPLGVPSPPTHKSLECQRSRSASGPGPEEPSLGSSSQDPRSLFTLAFSPKREGIGNLRGKQTVAEFLVARFPLLQGTAQGKERKRRWHRVGAYFKTELRKEDIRPLAASQLSAGRASQKRQPGVGRRRKRRVAVFTGSGSRRASLKVTRQK